MGYTDPNQGESKGITSSISVCLLHCKQLKVDDFQDMSEILDTSTAAAVEYAQEMPRKNSHPSGGQRQQAC